MKAGLDKFRKKIERRIKRHQQLLRLKMDLLRDLSDRMRLATDQLDHHGMERCGLRLVELSQSVEVERQSLASVMQVRQILVDILQSD